MKIIIAGGTGFIGSALAQKLENRGDEVTILSRKGGTGRITWEDPLPVCDGIINLCGEGILNQRWSAEFKEKIYKSRVETTEKLVAMIQATPLPPKFLINASAVGYYGDRKEANEESCPGEGFLAHVCQDWENAAKQSPTPKAIVRIGVTLGKRGGTFRRLYKIFRGGVGGRVGNGKQGFPWIHLDDLVALFLFILDGKREGIFNGSAPDRVTNSQFTKELGRALNRKTLFPLPAWILRLALGEGAEALLEGAFVYPKKALQEGFAFQFPTLEKALKDLCSG